MIKKTLVLFLGNPILADDKIGLVVGEVLKARLESEGYDVEIVEKTGFSLIDYLENRDAAIIVDSVMTRTHQTGEVIAINIQELRQYAPFTSHYVGIPEALELMRRVGLNPPGRLHILGIEVEDPYTISENMSQKLTAKLNELREEIHRIISSFGSDTAK